jgi:hypothetical protein
MYFSRRLRGPDNVLQLNGLDVPFVNNEMYLGVTYDKRMTWNHNIKRTVTKAHLEKTEAKLEACVEKAGCQSGKD